MFKTVRTSLLSRSFYITSRLASGMPPMGGGPAPPRLPKEQQEEFERLQQQASQQRFVEAKDDTLHPQFRKPYADFEGDKNPETGEIGGPKQDPLRHGDYSFNGRVTDF